MKFKDINLHPLILKAIKDSKYEDATPIQAKSIPEILKGSDILASAHTGTGKTAAFLLPALHKLANQNTKSKNAKVLILVPTRELALQVYKQALKYSRYLRNIKTVCIYGGIPYYKQRKELNKKHDILIATPGRLIDYLDNDKISLNEIELLILDEADRMLDMGFIQPVKKIARSSSSKRQTLLFSATLKNSILNLTKDLLKNPITIKTNDKDINLKNIKHYLYKADDLNHKLKLLNHFLDDEKLTKAIIFTSTKSFSETLCKKLKETGHKIEFLHGDIPQRKRERIIAYFSQNKTKHLIATDVAARGIDVKNISHVINFDIPMCAEDYIHRIGRTGRANENGTAYSFSLNKDTKKINEIENLLSKKIDSATVEGLEPKERPKQRKEFGKKDFKKGFKKKFFKKSFKKSNGSKNKNFNNKSQKTFR
ncbi:MAG: ATP-dependent RNA helicase RhlE [Candidatus Anoxychlamydiales bacterium]|nr:ATP-dependent RNA helicase RhlE [Candidatus Anoxychlamydiales bacterium]